MFRCIGSGNWGGEPAPAAATGGCAEAEGPFAGIRGSGAVLFSLVVCAGACGIRAIDKPAKGQCRGCPRSKQIIAHRRLSGPEAVTALVTQVGAAEGRIKKAENCYEARRENILRPDATNQAPLAVGGVLPFEGSSQGSRRLHVRSRRQSTATARPVSKARRQAAPALTF